MTHCMLASATPTISGFTAREMPQVPTRGVGGVTKKPQFAWAARGMRPLSNPLDEGTLPFKNSPHTRYLGQRAAEKPSTFLASLSACA